MNFMSYIMTAVMGLVLMVALFPLINDLVGTVVSSNMSSFAYSSIIVVLISMTGIFLAIGFLQGLLDHSSGTPPQGF